MLGDGQTLNTTSCGVVALTMELPEGALQESKLHEALLVSDLLYNLLSVSQATEAGKTVQFNDDFCSITNHCGKWIATASRTSNLYYVNCQSNSCQVNTMREMKQEKSQSGTDTSVI